MIDVDCLSINRSQRYCTKEIDLNRTEKQEMNSIRQNDPKIMVVGLGYVGLPLAIALERKLSLGSTLIRCA